MIDAGKLCRKALDTILRLVFVPKCVICADVILDEIEMCPECLEVWKGARLAKCPVCNKTARGCTCRTFHGLYTDKIGERSMSALAFYGKFGSDDLRDILVRRLVYSVKTADDRSAVNLCARELSADILKTILLAGDKPSEYTLTYPPRSRKRIKKYGFDHGRDLARRVSKYTGIPVRELFKNKGRKTQKSLDSFARLSNANSSYELLKNADIKGKYIIIDDVITTGATVNACARLLKEKGAELVYPACIARSKRKKRKLRRPSSRPWFKVKL